MSDTTLPVTDADGTERNVAFDLTSEVYTPKTMAVQSGSWSVGVTGSVAVTGTFWQTTQPVSGTVAATQSGTWNVNINNAPVLGAGTNTIGKVDHTTFDLGHGVKTVAVAGTHEALASSTNAKWVIVQAQTDNTGIIAVGSSGVDATVATGTGIALEAGDSVTIPCDNISNIFIDATVSGEGVRYIYGI